MPLPNDGDHVDWRASVILLPERTEGIGKGGKLTLEFVFWHEMGHSHLNHQPTTLHPDVRPVARAIAQVDGGSPVLGRGELVAPGLAPGTTSILVRSYHNPERVR